MAISKILHINSHPKLKDYHLKVGINYILKDEKTMDGMYTGYINCTKESAYECMRSTKNYFGKNDKRQGYHLIISFEENETNPDTAFEIIKEVAEEYLKDNYEAVYSVHIDTKHIHGHIIWNSVRFTDGYKYRYEKGDWEREIQPLVNKVCERHGLKSLDPSIRANVEKDWDVQKNGPFVWSEQIKKDVDACIIAAADFQMFTQLLEEKEYQIKYGKYIAVKPKGMKRFRRLETLGEEYSENKIKTRIGNKPINTYRKTGIISSPKIIVTKGKIKKRKELKGLQKQYFAILYKLGKIHKKPYSQSWKYKDDVKKLKRLQREYLFLSRYDINTEEDILITRENIKQKITWHNGAKKILLDESKKYQELFKAVDVINKEKMGATFYMLGDSIFKKSANEVSNANNILKRFDMNIDEASKLKDYYNNLLTECKKKNNQYKLDLYTSKTILKEIEIKKETSKQSELQRNHKDELVKEDKKRS